MDSLVQDHFHFSRELQCFRGGHGFCETGVKSASSAPRPKSAHRGSKSTIFAGGPFQLFNLQKNGMNPVGDPSVLPTQSPIYL